VFSIHSDKPGLRPDSFLPEAAMSNHALAYNQLIHKLVEASIMRTGGQARAIAV
jgi:hypothetical protein